MDLADHGRDEAALQQDHRLDRPLHPDDGSPGQEVLRQTQIDEQQGFRTPMTQKSQRLRQGLRHADFIPLTKDRIGNDDRPRKRFFEAQPEQRVAGVRKLLRELVRLPDQRPVFKAGNNLPFQAHRPMNASFLLPEAPSTSHVNQALTIFRVRAMPLSLTPVPKRILVIGPMGTQKDRRGLTYRDHIPNIAAAARSVLARLSEKLGPAMPNCEVFEPPNIPGPIPNRIFSLIMHCDFAIADISSGSPNVMYELAMLHANGVPVILLGMLKREQIFYLAQDNSLPVPDFRPETIASALTGDSFTSDGRPGQLEQLITSSPQRRFSNPITQFFGGVDMINVAAATGVATGQFYNFLRWVIKDGGIFQRDPSLKDIVLIRPERIKDVNRVTGLLEQRFRAPKRDKDNNLILEDGKPKLEVPEIVVPEPDHPRDKYFVKRIGSHLVDYPTPISSLSVSKQYRQFGDFLQEIGKPYEDDLLPPFERRLIGIYFDTLRELSESPANDCDWGYVKVMSIEQALDYLGT